MRLTPFQKTRYLIVVSVILLLTPLMLFPSLTGLAAMPLYKQRVSLEFATPKAYALDIATGEPLTSFRINGEIEGNGKVEIALQDKRGRAIAVFSNVRRRKGGIFAVSSFFLAVKDEPAPIAKQEPLQLKRLPAITPVLDARLLKGYETYDGLVSGACKDTCSIPKGSFGPDGYKLIVMVEPGTIFRLDDVIYTLG